MRVITLHVFQETMHTFESHSLLYFVDISAIFSALLAIENKAACLAIEARAHQFYFYVVLYLLYAHRSVFSNAFQLFFDGSDERFEGFRRANLANACKGSTHSVANLRCFIVLYCSVPLYDTKSHSCS